MNSFSQNKSDREIVVAIIDTGVDISHPLIRDNLWINPKENKSNNTDDDGNGYADDLHGWNFVSNNGDLTDHHGHGTHIAGIIKQTAHSKRVRFMILKYYDPTSAASDNLLNTVKAIRYAVKMRADIINYSGGGNDRSAMEEAAIREAESQGILFVAAAGNDGRNTDVMGYYPAGYQISNIISVAASDSLKGLLASSNFGRRTVDIAAPGKDIFSSLPGGKYGYMSGTSQATAWVSGLATSLMLNHERGRLTPADIKDILERNGIQDPQLAQKIRSRTRISSLQARLAL